MRIFLIISGLVLAGISFGQPSLSVSSTQALIGDQLELTLQIPLPGQATWINADVEPADTVASVEVLQTFSPEQVQGAVRKRWTIAVFDTGYVRIPPLEVVLENNGVSDTFLTNDIPLRIEGIVDSAGMAPIKPIVREPVQLSDYIPYVVGAIGLVLLILAGIWWSRRPKKEPEVVVIRDEKPPHIHAFERLDTLEAQQLWQKGEIKKYHSELSHITREYLENRYGIQALEHTTGEIVEQLGRLELGSELVTEIKGMMEVEDLVKFAKAKPPVEVHAGHMELVRTFIRNTKIEPQNALTHA